MANLILNKPATASNSFSPFLPAKAVDGVISPLSRWISSQVPAWLTVDLQDKYYIAQWSATFMGALNSPYWPASQYNMSDFKLQGSTDGSNWFDMDTLVNNTASTINRNIIPAWTRYLRIYITKGLKCNPQVSSILDFQASEVDNVPLLSGLIPSVGSLSPAFRNRTFEYSVNVESTVGSIAFTPTASSGTIKVGNETVASGSQSAPIHLNSGDNLITIEVTSGTLKTTYKVHVNKAASASYLSALAVRDNDGNDVDLDPAFQQQQFTYTIFVDSGIASVKIKPVAVDASATVKVNGVIVTSGSWSALIPVNNGTSIPVLVNSTSYTIVVHKT